MPDDSLPSLTRSGVATMWRYKVAKLSDLPPPLEDRLNELGDQGWMLVAIYAGCAVMRRVQ